MGSVEQLKTVDWYGTPVPVYPMDTIDFGKILSAEEEEVDKLLRCCQREGFFYLDLNGLDGRRFLDDQKETLDLMYRFFDAPLEAKNQFGLVHPHLGYVHVFSLLKLASLTSTNSYEGLGSRTGVLPNTKDGYEMVKVLIH